MLSVFYVMNENFDKYQHHKVEVLEDLGDYFEFSIDGNKLQISEDFVDISSDEKQELLDIYVNDDSFINNKFIRIFVNFENNPVKSYHTFLKYINYAYPSNHGVIDIDGFQYYSSDYLKFVSSLHSLFSCTSVFKIHGVCDDNQFVWLHTHGLSRFGIPELEIPYADEKHTDMYLNIINTLACHYLDNGYDEELHLIAHTTSNQDIYVCLEESERERYGFIEENHDALMIVCDHEGHDLREYIDDLEDNPIFFYTEEETNRMQSYAQDNFYLYKDYFLNKNSNVFIESQFSQDNHREYIWMKIVSIKGEEVKGQLLQNSHFFENLNENTICSVQIHEISNWLLELNDEIYYAKDAYLLGLNN